MVFSPSTTTTAGGYTYVGNISSASTVTLTLSGGMTQPHFSLELDCWMITLDGPSWIQTNQISIALGGGSTQTRVLSTKDDLDDVLSAGSNQSFYRIAETFAHTAVSTQIQFTFSTNQATGKKYGIK